MKQVDAQESEKKLPIQLAAISDMDIGNPIAFSPGLMFDIGFRLMNKPKINTKGIREREFYIKPFAGFYKREDYHTAVMIGTDLTYRATYPAGVFWDFNVGTGYMHLFYNTPVYEYNASNNSFKEKKLQGYSNVVVKGAIDFGYDFSKNNARVPLGVYAGMGLFFRYPNNDNWVRHPYGQLGLIYTIRK
ncbi:MAG: hypothetical protein M9887_05470 [Chitinophagales bacterium]|nr:hypothetical protein [Chitinophagales bacterium]